MELHKLTNATLLHTMFWRSSNQLGYFLKVSPSQWRWFGLVRVFFFPQKWREQGFQVEENIFISGFSLQMVGQPRVDHFNFHNCGKNTDPIQVTSLQLGPDPLKIPGNITLAVKAATTQTLAAPIKVRNFVIAFLGKAFQAPMMTARKLDHNYIASGKFPCENKEILGVVRVGRQDQRTVCSHILLSGEFVDTNQTRLGS